MKFITRFIFVILAIVIGLAIVGHSVEQSKPQLPVAVSYRQALLGDGLVARFTNRSPGTLELRVQADSPATHFYHDWYLVIPSGGTREVGWLQGWDFLPGQQIELSNANFRPKENVVP